MNDILLINSPLFKSNITHNEEDTLPSFGLVYIASYLKERNIQVELIDAVKYNLSPQQLIKHINDHPHKFIGINVFSTNYNLVKEVVEGVQVSTNFIIGGLATKELYSQIVGWSTENKIDIVIGDGELITYDIITNNLKEAPLYHDRNRRVYNVSEKSEYYIKNISDINLDRRILATDPDMNFHGILESNIVTSRGCSNNCAFCAAASAQNLGFGVRERSKESIIRELEIIHDLCPDVKSIRILDDLFLKSKRNINKAIDIFSEFDFTWRSMAWIRTFYPLGQNDINKLYKSGCSEIFTGIESGSPNILRSINKKIDRNITLIGLEKLFRSGINVKGYFIYGFPGETYEDMEMTYNFATDLKALAKKFHSTFRISVFQFRPYHGTELYKRLTEQDTHLGQIVPNEELNRKIGREQYNFSSGNYSKVEDSTLLDYISRTNDLNDPGKNFKRIFKASKSKRKQEV